MLKLIATYRVFSLWLSIVVVVVDIVFVAVVDVMLLV